MVQAEWVRGNSSNLELHMRGNYKITVNLQKNLAEIPGTEKPVPFFISSKIA